jgi:hypothetical protein
MFGWLAGMEAGCMDSWVFAMQKPKAKKWHGGRLFFPGVFALRKLRKVKLHSSLTRARDRAEIPEARLWRAEELER